MTNILGTEFKPTMVDDKKRRIGRSTKTLKPVVKFAGRVWIAFWEGRGNKFFGSTQREALANLRGTE